MQIVIVTVIVYTDGTVLYRICAVILGRRCVAFPIPPCTASWRSKAYWQQPAARDAARNDADKSGIHRRGARAAHGAKDPALERHRRRYRAIALNLLLEG